jgi:hypothetical protein
VVGVVHHPLNKADDPAKPLVEPAKPLHAHHQHSQPHTPNH